MRINVNDSDTGGMTGSQHVSDGITVTGFFRQYKPGKDMKNYRVRVNEQQVNADCCIREGDRLTISPGKLAGATPRR